MRRSIATPCPVTVGHYRDIDETYSEDTTTNLEYTTAFQASFRNVRPKRAQVARRGATNFAIHEDVAESKKPNMETLGGPPSRLSQPAKRILPRGNAQNGTAIAQNPVEFLPSTEKVSMIGGARPSIVPKRLPPRPSIVPGITLESKKNSGAGERDANDRPVRRKTLYVPLEDTTQPTMWMGIFSPIKNETTQEDNDNQSIPNELTGIAAQMAEKRKRRTSTVPVKAKRVPLQRNSTAQDSATITADRAGAPTGKENLPPGHVQTTNRNDRQEKPAVKKNKKAEVGNRVY